MGFSRVQRPGVEDEVTTVVDLVAFALLTHSLQTCSEPLWASKLFRSWLVPTSLRQQEDLSDPRT